MDDVADRDLLYKLLQATLASPPLHEDTRSALAVEARTWGESVEVAPNASTLLLSDVGVRAVAETAGLAGADGMAVVHSIRKLLKGAPHPPADTVLKNDFDALSRLLCTIENDVTAPTPSLVTLLARGAVPASWIGQWLAAPVAVDEETVTAVSSAAFVADLVARREVLSQKGDLALAHLLSPSAALGSLRMRSGRASGVTLCLSFNSPLSSALSSVRLRDEAVCVASLMIEKTARAPRPSESDQKLSNVFLNAVEDAQGRVLPLYVNSSRSALIDMISVAGLPDELPIDGPYLYMA